MDRLPLKARIGPPSVWPERERNSPTDRSPTHSMAHEERERGEISERDKSRERDFRDRDRFRECVPHEDARAAVPPRRDDVYLPPRASHPASYARDTRDWNRGRDRDRDRDRDVRDEREWTRDTGRGRHFRGARGGWRDDRARERDMDRDRERFYERDRDRAPRSAYERPRERVWERNDRVRDSDRDRDRDGRYAKETYHDSSYSRRPEADFRYRSPPLHARARSPPLYIRHPNSRSPSPRSPPRAFRERSLSKTRDRSGSHIQPRRDDSIDSRRSSTRRGGAERERPSHTLRKRDRSYSPLEQDNRVQRRLRTTSPSPSPISDRRRSPSPAPSARRREEKQPERWSPPPTRSGPPSAPASTFYPRDRRETRAAPPDTPIEPRYAQQRLADLGASSRASVNTGTPPSRNSPAPCPVVASEKPIPSGPTHRASFAGPSRAETSTAPSPTTRVDIPINAPTGPRSAAVQPPPARLPEIPKWRPLYEPVNFAELNRFDAARLPLYAEYARTNAAARRATSEAEVAAIEFRSAEQRRIFAEQQKQRVLET